MGRRWSRDDEKYLIDSLRSGDSKLSIANVLGRSFDAVLTRIKVIAARERKIDDKEHEGDGQNSYGGGG